LVNACFCCVKFCFFHTSRQIGLGNVSEMTYFVSSGTTQSTCGTRIHMTYAYASTHGKKVAYRAVRVRTRDGRQQMLRGSDAARRRSSSSIDGAARHRLSAFLHGGRSVRARTELLAISGRFFAAAIASIRRRFSRSRRSRPREVRPVVVGTVAERPGDGAFQCRDLPTTIKPSTV